MSHTDCRQCHYEETDDGEVMLYVWGANSTASTITYDGTFANRYQVNVMCLSCHDADTTTAVWGGNPPADIDAIWTDSTTASYSKFDPDVYNVVPQLTKSYSPHNYPATNIAKFDGSGTDANMTQYEYTTRTVSDSAPVACLDCHPAHGSSVGSGSNQGGYNTATGASGGIMLLEARPAGSAQTYSNEEELCWDCHKEGMDYKGDTGTTASVTEWQGNWQNTPFDVKRGAFRSSHFYPSKNGAWTVSGSENLTTGSVTATGTPPSTRTNISCSTCHDPHGVPTGTLRASKVPILRGTWLTSPYKEDRPPFEDGTSGDANGYNAVNDVYGEWRFGTGENSGETVVSGNGAGDGARGARLAPVFTLNMPADLGFGYGAGDAATTYGKDPGTGARDTGGYFIDENTFGTSGGYFHPMYDKKANPLGTVPGQQFGTWYDGSSLQSITINHFSDDTNYDTLAEFAGLCITCHPETDLDNFDVHKTVPGVADAGIAWSNLFSRPYMHVMQRYNQNTLSLTECDWGDLAGYAAGGTWHDGECGYRWGYPPNDPTSAQTSYHQYSCSKCHTPHAARLERLLVTNCLDVGSSTTQARHSSYVWPQTYGGGAWGIASGVDPWVYNVTCHADHSGGTGGGWNSISPW
jgi:hypothetical protein